MNCPPKPHLTFRIGVTGHRPGLQLAAESLARAQSQIADIFKSANDALTQAHRQFQASYSSTSPQLRVISSIAEGADRIAAKAALACGLQLEVILPLDRQSYEVDFSTQESRNEFAELLARASAILEISDNSQVSTREQAYAAAGEELLAQCDLLLTVWDGAPGRGQGGTAEVLRTAHRLGIPYVWIHATRDVEPAIIAYPVKGVTRERESWSAQLQSVILGLVLPPGSPEGDSILRRDLARSAAAKSDNYFAENEHNARWALPYDLFRWIFAGRVPRRKSKIRKLSDRASEWKGFLNALPEIGELKRKLNSILLERYVWADHLATHYANIYRSTYVTIFGLAGLAVCVGLLSSFEDRDEITKAALIGFEVGLISIIVWLIHRGRGRAWHARWLDYRQIAEALRHARFLALTGRLTYGYSEEGGKNEATNQWTAWYVRASLRELGLPSCRTDKVYVASIVRATIVHEIDPQITFHLENARELAILSHSLESVGTFLFLTTLLVGVMFLSLMGVKLILDLDIFESVFDRILKPAEILLMAGLPAIGAAIAGVRAQGEFYSSADRSRVTAVRLTALRDELLAEIKDEPTFYRASTLLHAVGRTMASELGSWQFIYRHRPLSLPA